MKARKKCIAAFVSLALVTPAGAMAGEVNISGVTFTDQELRDHVQNKNGGLLALEEVQVPRPAQASLARFIQNEAAALALGKALFWDMQAGGDGVQACASCHFHAGADSRFKNQLTPGLKAGDETFQSTLSGGGGPNYSMIPADFPFPKEFNDLLSSQGVFLRAFENSEFSSEDVCTSSPDDVFAVPDEDGNFINVRRVEPRQTPTTINAVFNHRNFWDGRANDTFNGVSPDGIRDSGAVVYKLDGAGVPTPVRLVEGEIDFGPPVMFEVKAKGPGGVETILGEVPMPVLFNSSLASQAVGPPGSPFEMSCGARSFPDIAQKILRLRPLAKQQVHPDDSVLGPLRYPTGLGLRTTYGRLIMQAFKPEWWNSKERIAGTDFTQIEHNFSLFWGLAIQFYEATLVADDTPYDRWALGDDAALTDQEKLGLAVFSGFSPESPISDGRCINCHVGPEFTSATVRFRACQIAGGDEESIERMIMGNQATALYDGGFYNIGVRQTLEDLAVGANGGGGAPLSFSRQVTTDNVVDFFCVNQEAFEVNPDEPPAFGERVAVDGAFKTATVRNVELTAPYFHSGGRATLDQVVEFYNSGAGHNQCSADLGELGFHEENIDNLDPDINCINFQPEEEAALVAFMKALTDERVRYEMAPFDHPQLLVPHGHPVDENLVVEDLDHPGQAKDSFLTIPAVGAAGRTPPDNFLDPGQTF